MYVYYLKQDEDMGDGHILKKGKVMATSDENILSNYYNIIQLELTQEQLDKQGFLYIVDGKPFIDESEVTAYEKTIKQQNI